MLDISKWDDDDPITREQVEVLNDILMGQLTEEALEGFLIVSSRLVDDHGNHRTNELVKIEVCGSEGIDQLQSLLYT